MSATKTTRVPDFPSTSVPSNPSTPVYPAPVPTTTTTTVAPKMLPTTATVPSNCPNTVAPAPYPKITTNVSVNPLTRVVPEPDTAKTTCIYANTPTKHSPVPDPNPPPNPVAPVNDTPPPTTSTPTVVADCHGVKWYDYKYLIDLDEVTPLQRKFTNQFSNPLYPNSGVCMSRLDDWLMMYGKKNLLISLTKPTVIYSVKAGAHLRTRPRCCSYKV